MKVLSWGICTWLLLAYVPGALAGRIVSVKLTPWLSIGTSRLAEITDTPNIGQQDIILINPPLQIATVYAPCYRLYRGQTLPRSIRGLVPGYADLELQRVDENTLLVQTRTADIFTCGDLGPVRLAYACNTLDGIVLGRRAWKPGERQALRGMTAEIVEVSKQGLPSRVAFHFEESLDSSHYHWLQFDWRKFAYTTFSMPGIGETISVKGPANEFATQLSRKPKIPVVAHSSAPSASVCRLSPSPVQTR